MKDCIAEIYTDGSCHTQNCIGAWALIILYNDNKIVLSGKAFDTTHNRMEIVAVINALKYIQLHFKNITEVKVISDSQYVIGLLDRELKFMASDFKTKSGNAIRNIDLVKELLALIKQYKIQFIKIKAHQKATSVINHNIEVDKLCRQIVREEVKNKLLKINK